MGIERLEGPASVTERKGTTQGALGLIGRLAARRGAERVFDSPQRQQILKLVEENPGIPLSELMERTQSGWGTLYHHLAKLSQAGLVQTRLAGRRRLVYATTGGTTATQDAEARSILCGQTARRIAISIRNRPNRSVLDLSEELGDSPRAVYYHVRRLLNAGLISSASATRHFDLSPTPLLEQILAREEMADPSPTEHVGAP